MPSEFRTSLRRFAAIFLASGGLAAWSCAAHANVAISAAPTSNMSCSAGVCTATAANAILNVSDLQTMLAASDTTVSTGSVAASIVVGANLTWASASALTLNAKRSIIVNRVVTVSGTGALTLTTNTGGHGGDLTFGPNGRITFWGTSNALTINGASYTLVSTIADLASGIAANPSGNFALSNNYDAQPDGIYSSSPIPTTYTGNFQGLGNSISRLHIRDVSATVDSGLFAHIGTDGHVQSLRMATLNVSGRGNKSVGGLVSTNDGTLFGDSVAGAVTDLGGKAYVGLLAGTNNGTIGSSIASGTVAAIIGGVLVGRNADGAINNSSSSGTVSGGPANINFLGGLVGSLDAGSVNNSSSSANLSTGYGIMGGLVGRVFGLVSGSHATGATSAITSHDTSGIAGGLVGFVEPTGTVVRCYATGDVVSSEFGGGLVAVNGGAISQSFATGRVIGSPIGGLVGVNDASTLLGDNQASISNSYSTGSVSGPSGGPAAYAGGLIGQNGNHSSIGVVGSSYSTGPVSNAQFKGGSVGLNADAAEQGFAAIYWDTTTAGTSQAVGQGDSTGITGLTDPQLKAGLPAGFDPNIWAQKSTINNGFPYLIANPPP